MRILDRIAMDMRRKEVFDAGAKTRRLGRKRPSYQGHELGSNESCTFYDGYASTHPGFKNPYRRLG